MLSDSMRRRVIQTIAEHLGLEESMVTDEKSLVADLGADSLDEIELVMAMEDEFGIYVDDDEASKVVTVADAIAFVNRLAPA